MGRTLSAVPPVLESPAPQSAAFRQRCALLAMSAARAVTVFPEVAEARFAITGTPSAPALEVDCILRDGEDTAAVIETITVHLVEDLEELLGARFHERRLELVVDRSLPRVGVGVVSAP